MTAPGSRGSKAAPTAREAADVPAELHGKRAETALAKLMPAFTRPERRALFQQRQVWLDDVPVKKGDAVVAGRSLSWPAPAPYASAALVDGVVEVTRTERVLIVDKAAGIASHPLARGEGGTALDAALAFDPAIGSAGVDPREGGLLHRLDGGTEGLLAFARDREAHQALRQAFADGRVHKGYFAWVSPAPADDTTVHEGSIAHDAKDRGRAVIVDDETPFRGRPKPARTVASVLVRHDDSALIAVTAEGGRLHQVRVHLASAGSPLVGDLRYGGVPWARGGHALCACALGVSEGADARFSFAASRGVPPAWGKGAWSDDTRAQARAWARAVAQGRPHSIPGP